MYFVILHLGLFLTGIKGAEIHVTDRDHTIKSARDGDYWRLLNPGVYTLRVTKEGYEPVEAEVEVHTGPATKLSFEMKTEKKDGIPNIQDDAGIELASTEESRRVPVTLVVGLTVVCVVGLILAIGLAVMLTKQYKNKSKFKETGYCQVDPLQ